MHLVLNPYPEGGERGWGQGQAVHVGDDLQTDIKGGREAGLAATIWVNASGRPLPEGSAAPTRTVSHVSEVSGILKELMLS